MSSSLLPAGMVALLVRWGVCVQSVVVVWLIPRLFP